MLALHTHYVPPFAGCCCCHCYILLMMCIFLLSIVILTLRHLCSMASVTRESAFIAVDSAWKRKERKASKFTIKFKKIQFCGEFWQRKTITKEIHKIHKYTQVYKSDAEHLTLHTQRKHFQVLKIKVKTNIFLFG